MPPEPVTGLCILPRLRTISSTSARTAVAVAAVLGLELAEGGGVEVEALDAHPHLVVADRRVGVEPLGRLGQHAHRLQHPVHADRIACHAPHVVHDTFPLNTTIERKSCGDVFDAPQTSCSIVP